MRIIVLEYLPYKNQQNCPAVQNHPVSFVGFYIAAPWFAYAYGIWFANMAPGDMSQLECSRPAAKTTWQLGVYGLRRSERSVSNLYQSVHKGKNKDKKHERHWESHNDLKTQLQSLQSIIIHHTSQARRVYAQGLQSPWECRADPTDHWPIPVSDPLDPVGISRSLCG